MRWTGSPGVLPPSPGPVFLHHRSQGHVGWGLRSIREGRVEVGGGAVAQMFVEPQLGEGQKASPQGRRERETEVRMDTLPGGGRQVLGRGLHPGVLRRGSEEFWEGSWTRRYLY